MPEKIAITRIKLSDRLLALRVSGKAHEALGSRLCHLLGAEGINIALAAMGTGHNGFECLCCIDDQDHRRAKAVIDGDRELKPVLDFLPAKGLVGLFPHQHRFHVFGLALKALTEQHIKIHGLATSISALSFVIDFERLHDAADALTCYFQKM